MSKSILFVCLGNICRSPTGEAVLREMAQTSGIDLRIDSAGTASWHEGKPPHPPMQATAHDHGIDMSKLRARQVRRSDLDDFDLILAMDAQNMSDLRALWPKAPSQKLKLLSEFGPSTGPKDVPDPYYTDDYEGTFAIIHTACSGLLSALQPKQN